MRKIAGPGHVSNEFADYDPITNPDGTVVTAQWANDVQRELIGVQDEFSIAEADGSNTYILSAIKGMAIKYGKKLGEVFFSEEYEAPAAFDKDNPEDFNPAVCLSSIEDHLDISATNWPDLVPVLRARPAYYMHNKTGEKYQFDVTNWAIVSNVATLTFANTTAELAILGVLSEDTVAHGGYGNWQTITLASAIGDIAAGDYAITDVDAASRTISFAYAASDNSGGVTAVASFYRHRVAGSTTTARLFPVDGYAIMSEGSDRVSGFRKLDQMQRITGDVIVASGSAIAPATGAFYQTAIADGVAATSGSYNRFLVSLDSSGSPNARTSATTDGETRPRNIAAYMYLWGRSYVA
ncbi:hypothetical protein B4O97_03430 [Marispirochaeta aestuarii]|uniref:Tail fiber protein n=1 Tax=Marispirochaeta aestuarii TaxID=1963862 RepID=A0A1Y1S2U6_9SPIO|nr:hypothetical protein [Marispirochaeta aestuarii]ORC37254.1 hypothetical protein B4O97_03430 [Marispirochaeta aestuarii]